MNERTRVNSTPKFVSYTIDSYGCPGGPPCGGLRVALVERINHAGLADVKNAYYSGDAKIAQCVQQVCGAGKKLEEGKQLAIVWGNEH